MMGCDDEVTLSECDVSEQIPGGIQRATETDRVSILSNWVKARSALVAKLRKEAEADAKEAFDELTKLCPVDCPTLIPIGKPSYITDHGISGETSWLWIRYDAWAESEMVQDFKCVAGEEDSESNEDDD